MRGSETTLRLLLLAGSLVVAIAFFATLGWTGIVDYRALFSTPKGDFFASTNVADPELVHLHPPHFHFKQWLVAGGDITAIYHIPRKDRTPVQCDLNYDRNGFRNPVDLEKADTAVIGDSFVEAIPTPDAELLTTRLARFQAKTVANLGQYGWGPVEELAVLRRFALPLRPDTVVWMFFEGNDLRDLAFSRKYRSGVSPPSPPRPEPKRSFLRTTLAQIRGVYSRTFKPSGIKRAGFVKLADGTRQTVYFRYASQGYSEDDLRALDDTAAILANAEKLSAANGTRFLFVFIPIKYRALRDSTEFPPESECRNWKLNDMPDRLRKAVGPTSSAVGFLDLTTRFANAMKKGRLSYYVDDDHWSSEGQSIAAEAISQYVSSMSAPGAGLAQSQRHQ